MTKPLVAGIAVLALGGMGQAATSGGSPPAPANEPSPRYERTECPFDTSGVEPGELHCGYLTVPESRGEDDDRTLRIAVAVVDVPDATEDPVVLLPGGPGGGALQYHELVRRWLPSDRSVVLFDPRGTGHSGPTLCPELTETESAIAALDLSVEEARLVERGAHLSCRDRLLRQGVDLDAYNSTSIALDVRDLRRALGYERWNLLAVSYGVPVARAVKRLDPEATRSAILAIGPGPVATDLLRMDIPFFARALERVFRGCAAATACQESFPDLEEEFYRVHASLKREPLTVPVDPGQFHADTFTVNSQDYVLMIYRLLASEAEVVHLPALIRAFGERDQDVVRRMVEREYGGLSSSYSVGMASSVMCYDAHTPGSWAEWREAAAPYPSALAEIKYFLLPCDDWGEERASEEERTPFRSRIPTLVITGEFDPASSPGRDESQLRWLPKGHQVTIPGMAHFPESRSMACWASLIEQFVRDPQQRPDDSCTEELPEVKILPELPSWAESENQEGDDP